jgi:hypothetical protein
MEAPVSRTSDEAEGFRHISWISAMLFRVFGPADLPNGPLKGTRYDPQYRQQRQREQVRVRQAKIAERLSGKRGDDPPA